MTPPTDRDAIVALRSVLTAALEHCPEMTRNVLMQAANPHLARLFAATEPTPAAAPPTLEEHVGERPLPLATHRAAGDPT
jgi:hypothetical protein